ncbi:MAG: amidohydrolase family protein [Gammaproteobacteria bacterium]|nr:amidohydrolase family protein [Gammaproteobacteria bacterium]
MDGTHIKKIDFETHFILPEFLTYLNNRTEYPYCKENAEKHQHLTFHSDKVTVTHNDALVNHLLSLADARLQLMDETGIDIQILSHTVPSFGVIENADVATSLARDANDLLADAIKKNPTRFRGFAAIAPQDTKSAVKELERCITELGFVGWLTHSNYGENKYLDDKQYWPLLELAESLNIPIYLHPTIPGIKQYQDYGYALAGPGFGFHAEASLLFMRMILAGVFEEFPKLQVMMGHLGEGIPFFMERLDFAFDKAWAREALKRSFQRKPTEILRQNTYVTVSGRFYEAALKYTIEAMGSDRILFATDHPYESMQHAVDYVAKASISEEDRKKIFCDNAQKFVK